MNPFAKPFTPKVSKKNDELEGLPIYYNKESGQLMVFLETTKNLPKGYEKLIN